MFSGLTTFGNYEWDTIKTSTVTNFAIKFWTVIWAVVHLLDMKLLQSIQVNSGGLAHFMAQVGTTRWMKIDASFGQKLT